MKKNDIIECPKEEDESGGNLVQFGFATRSQS